MKTYLPTPLTFSSFLRSFAFLMLCQFASAALADDDKPKAPAIADEKANASGAEEQSKAPVAAESKSETSSYKTEKLKPPVFNGDQIVAEVRYIKAPRALANSLFAAKLGAGHLTEVKDEVLKQLAEWEKQKKVATAFQPKITTMCGEESICEAIREALYNTKSVGADGKVDTSTEMRPVGMRFAVLPNLSRDGKTIFFRLQFELTTMTLREEKSATASAALPVSPSFSTNKIDTSLFMTSGTTVLLSVIDDPENNGSQKESDDIALLLLTATANEKRP